MTLSVAALALVISITMSGDDQEHNEGRLTAQTGDGTVLIDIEKTFERQQELDRAAEDQVNGVAPSFGVGVYEGLGAADRESPAGNAMAYAPRGDDSRPIGVCMLTDLEPAVENLPACADLLDPDEPDETPSEDDDEAAAEDTPEPIIITVTRSDFAELPLNQPRVHLQPDRDWFLVNMDTLVYTDGAPQVLQATVLDVPVAVRATPVQYAWDFGDGTQPLVTTEPGAPWPATDIAHVYTSEATDVVVTLTTTWSGEFQVAGQGPWIPIAGTTTTESQSAPFRVDAVETRLTAEG